MPKLVCKICGSTKDIPKCCDKSMIIIENLLCCCSENSKECGYQPIPECCGEGMKYMGF